MNIGQQETGATESEIPAHGYTLGGINAHK